MSSIDQNNLTESKFEGIDVDKGLSVLKKSLLWILAIFLTTNTIAYLSIRWTKPLFESQSELKLDVKSDASELGLGFSDNKNLNVISGEIELIKSKLFTYKVIETVDLSVSYYTAGQFLNDEKYKSTPFEVEYTLKNGNLYDRRIYIEVINKEKFKISFIGEEFDASNEFKFGEIISTNDINLTVNLTKYFDPDGDRRYFFIINSEDALVRYFQNNLIVEPLNLNANIIKIALRDHNPYKARDLVNAIDSIYLNYTQQEKNLENNQKIAWLNQELSEIEVLLEGYEDYFENFTIRNRTNNLDEDLTRTIAQINQLDSQRYLVSNKLQTIQELKLNYENSQNESIFVVNYSELPAHIVDGINKLNELDKKKEDLKLSYNETTFALSRIDNEFKAAKKLLLGQLESLEKSYQAKVKDLIIRKKKLEDNFVKLPEKSTEYNKKQRFFELYEEFYLSLMQNKAQFQIAQAGTTTEFKILSPATLPSQPISPNRMIIHGIGFVLGFLISFFFLATRYIIHNKITTTNELERLTKAPILGTIPVATEKMEITKLIIHNNPKSAVSEALRSLRTNIEFMMSSDQHRVMSVTSTISGEGKTFVSVNLGGIIALSKRRVVVLDLDMRKPRVHMSFSNSNREKGVSTILINKHSIEECIVTTDIENLDYIPAGPTPPNPSELLLNGDFDKLMDKLKDDYDLVILDTPPVGLVTDGVLAMKKADLALYIVRANYSKKLFIKTLNQLINVNQFKNLAVVLNATSTNGSNNYGYGYGYYEDVKKSPNILKRLAKNSA